MIVPQIHDRTVARNFVVSVEKMKYLVCTEIVADLPRIFDFPATSNYQVNLSPTPRRTRWCHQLGSWLSRKYRLKMDDFEKCGCKKIAEWRILFRYVRCTERAYHFYRRLFSSRRKITSAPRVWRIERRFPSARKFQQRMLALFGVIKLGE